ncbi:MAG: glycosyl transferase family protein [Halioglobus sp.]
MTSCKDGYNPKALAIEHPFARYIRILGKGKTGSRSLTQEEAKEAFSMILHGESEDLQIGAFLMLLRVKEETPEELAGFVQACRENMLQPPSGLYCDLDWSAYAGKKHHHPWFILSAVLLADAGYRILIHGAAGHTQGRLYMEDGMCQLGLSVASNWTDVSLQLNQSNLSYFSLQHFCPTLESLMQLRALLGLRSPVNTLSRLINPLHANVSLQSVFHPSYARLHQEADAILDQPRALVFKGESGEIEIKPQADTRISLLENGKIHELVLPRTIPNRVESVGTPGIEPLRDLWKGNAIDSYGLHATLATTATGLLALTPGLDIPSAQHQARELWENRNSSRLN